MQTLFQFFGRFENKHFYINLIYYISHFLQNVLLKVFSQITFTLQVIYELFGNRLSHSVKWTILFKSIQKKYNTYQNPSNGMILIQAYGQFFFLLSSPFNHHSFKFAHFRLPDSYTIERNAYLDPNVKRKLGCSFFLLV